MSVVRSSVRVTAAAMVIGVGGLTALPAFAASEVGHGQASAVNIAIAGMGQSVSGTYAASNDGTKETTSGSRNPAITVLGTQRAISQGTLAQDATTSIKGKVVSSAACAGVSGDGATLANVGASDSCFKTTDTLSLNSGALDAFKNFNPLTDIVSNGQLTPTFIAAFPMALQDLIKASSAQIATALTTGLQQALASIGNPSLTLDATAIEGRCTATQGTTTGSATLADAGLTLDFGAKSPVDPIKIAVPDENPAPNTKLVTDLDAITTAITNGLTDSLTTSTGPLGQLLVPLGVTVDQLAAALNPLIDQISDQLGPVEDNLLDVTLNKQTSDSDSQIHVTALDLQVLPAASQVTGSSLASIQLGDVDCLGGTFTPAANTTTAGTKTGSKPASSVPTNIDSGLAGDSSNVPQGVLAALGALFLVAAGGVGVRKIKMHQHQG